VPARRRPAPTWAGDRIAFEGRPVASALTEPMAFHCGRAGGGLNQGGERREGADASGRSGGPAAADWVRLARPVVGLAS
jgi:hypothetical protein